MSDILFIKTSSLGDVIHQMPAVTEARRHLPDARFAWVVEKRFAPLVALHPLVDTVIPVDSRGWRKALLAPSTWREVLAFRAMLRSRRYDTIIDTQGLLFKSALIAWAARGKRHGYGRGSVREGAASFLYQERHTVSRDLHAIARNRMLTGLALGYTPQGEPDYGLDRTRLAGTPAGRHAVLLHATARPEKEWPEAQWIALGTALAGRGLEVVLPWGSEAERERSVRLAAQIPGARVPALQPLDTVARLIAGASLVVGVDTGLMHLAAALQVPLVAVFVGTAPALYGPQGRGPIEVVGRAGTVPTVDEVLGAAGRVLAI
jgi:heptosyltransferase-1